jgi:hypothetical protein
VLSNFYSRVVDEYKQNDNFRTIVETDKDIGKRSLNELKKEIRNDACQFSTFDVLTERIRLEFASIHNLGTIVANEPVTSNFGWRLKLNRHIREVDYVGDTVYVSRYDTRYYFDYFTELARFAGMKVERFDADYLYPSFH